MILTSTNIAIQSLKKNKGRTILTILGIVIGITAVIAVLSLGQAIRGFIVGQVESFGSNLIQVEVKTPQTSHTSTENAFSMVGGAVINTLKNEDLEAIGKLSNINAYYGGIMGQKLVNYENKLKKALIFGTDPAFIDIDTTKLVDGRFFSDMENQGLAQVVVLGSKIKKNLFDDNNPIGESVKIGNGKFQVIGYMEEKGASFGMDMDNMIFMPVRTLQKRVLGVDYLSFAMVQVKDNSIADQTAEDMIQIMRERHKITDPDKDDFAVTTMAQMMKMMDTILYGIQILLIALGSISLIVGGVGIMNIMYVSVTERTFEIGLRKSLGAKNKDILWQFLAEAIIITLIGACFGIALGIGLSWLVATVASLLGIQWNFSISWTGLFLAVIMSVGVGVGFGLYPAKMAADKDPIEAIRFE